MSVVTKLFNNLPHLDCLDPSNLLSTCNIGWCYRKPTSRYEVLRLKEVMEDMMEKSGVNDEMLESVGPTQVGGSTFSSPTPFSLFFLHYSIWRSKAFVVTRTNNLVLY